MCLSVRDAGLITDLALTRQVLNTWMDSSPLQSLVVQQSRNLLLEDKEHRLP